jgi:hypothetical protein
MIVTKTWTYNLVNNTLIIDETFGLTNLSILLTSGTGSVTGSLASGGLPSQPLALTIGQPLNISSGSSSQIILGTLTVTTGGTIEIIGR